MSISKKPQRPSVMDELAEEIGRTQVVLIAGGLGKRLGQPDKPKCLVEINGKTLIERAIEYFRANGFTEYVVLVGYLGEQVERLLGDGSGLGVHVRYSYDPGDPGKVGKAKALKHAILNGAVDKSRKSIIAFPDDVFLDSTLPTRLLLTHMEYTRSRGTIATVVLASGYRLPFGVARVNGEGLVESFEEKPVLSYYVNTGIYVMDPPAYRFVLDNVDMSLGGPIELETAVLPKIASMGLLAAFVIPASSWIPINTLKDLEEAASRIR